MKIKTFLFRLIALLVFKSTLAEEKCDISNDELSKMSHTLKHVEETVYSVDEYKSGNEECNYLIHNIQMQLMKLTQRYKLMNKRYVEAEAQKNMAKDYEDQLKKLTEEFEQLKKKTTAEASAKLTELEKTATELEKDSSKLQTELKAVVTEYEKVVKDLCLTFLRTNQMASAKVKLKELSSTFLMEVIDGALKTCGKSVMPVIDFCSAISDLDDRAVAYQEIFKFIEGKEELSEDSHVLLEAAVLKMNASLKSDSKITEEGRNKLDSVLEKLLDKTKITFDKWIINMNKSENFHIIKGALDHLFVNQMKYLAEKASNFGDFYTVRNFLRLTVVSNNYYKLAAYQAFTNNKVASGLGEIMFDMILMKQSEMDQDKHVPGLVPKLFNDTMEALPKSLNTIALCYKHVYINNALQSGCISVTDSNEVIKHPKTGDELGEFKRTLVTDPSKCTKFRLELTDDRASLRIVTHQGEPLTAINSALLGDSYMGLVGAAYKDKPDKHLDHSTSWLLEANYDNEMIKIKSEFNGYRMGRSVDHLLEGTLLKDHHLFVRRFGNPGLKNSPIKAFSQWFFECAPK